jgi:hypothetical protein
MMQLVTVAIQVKNAGIVAIFGANEGHDVYTENGVAYLYLKVKKWKRIEPHTYVLGDVTRIEDVLDTAIIHCTTFKEI